MTAVPVYLDCDTGVDDALALPMLLGHPEVALAGIGTVSGNTAAGQAARNTLNLLALAGRDDLPVAVGAHHPLAGAFGGGAAQVHGGNGVGGVELPAASRAAEAGDAADLLLGLARRHAGELRIVATGPLTNLALALRREPGLADFYEPALGERRVPLHDPLAAGVATGELTPAEAPLLGLRVEPDGKLVEDPAVASRTRVVLPLTGDAAPVILRAALRRSFSSSSSGQLGGSA
jgi:hypothetical protein